MAIPNISDYNTWDGNVFTHPEIDGNSQKTIDFLTTNYDVTFNSVTASEYVGIPSDQFSTITAGENLSAGDVVRISSGQAFKADNTSSAGITAVVGVCNTTVSSGQTVKIDYGFYNSFSSLTVGTIYYIGTGGGITATKPSLYPVEIGRAVSTTRINLNFREDETPTGTIIATALTTAPKGYIECDGLPVSRTTHARLFAKIGTTWGIGDGSTTFGLPDERDRYLRGRSSTYSVGSYLGELTKLPTTAFTGTTSSNGAHTHEIAYGYHADNNPNNDRVAYGGNTNLGTKTTQSSGVHTHTTTITGGGDSETRPKTSVVLYCIKL